MNLSLTDLNDDMSVQSMMVLSWRQNKIEKQ